MRAEDDQGSTTRILRPRDGLRSNSAGRGEQGNENRAKTRSRTVDGNAVKKILTDEKTAANEPMNNSSTDDCSDAATTNTTSPKETSAAAAPKNITIKRAGTKRSRRMRAVNDGDDERNASRPPGKRRRIAPSRYSPRPESETRQRRASLSEEDGNVASNAPQRTYPVVTLKPVNFGETFEERQRRREIIKKERNNNTDSAHSKNNDGNNSISGGLAVAASGCNTNDAHPGNQNENNATTGGEASGAKVKKDIPVITIDEVDAPPLSEANSERNMAQNHQLPTNTPTTPLIHAQQVVAVPGPTTDEARSKFHSAVATAANNNGYYTGIPYRLPVARISAAGRSDGALPALAKRDVTYTHADGVHVYNYTPNFRMEPAARQTIMQAHRPNNALNKVPSHIHPPLTTYSARTSRNALLSDGTLRFALGTQWSLRVSEVCYVGPNFDSALVRKLGPYPEELCTELLPKIVNDLIRCSHLPIDVLNTIESIDPSVPHDTIKLQCQGQLKFRYIPLVQSVSEAKHWLANFLEMNDCCSQLFIEDAYDCRLCTMKSKGKDRNMDCNAVSKTVEQLLPQHIVRTYFTTKVCEVIKTQKIDYKTLVQMELQEIKNVFQLQQSDAFIVHSVIYQLRQFIEKNVPESLIVTS